MTIGGVGNNYIPPYATAGWASAVQGGPSQAQGANGAQAQQGFGDRVDPRLGAEPPGLTNPLGAWANPLGTLSGGGGVGSMLTSMLLPMAMGPMGIFMALQMRKMQLTSQYMQQAGNPNAQFGPQLPYGFGNNGGAPGAAPVQGGNGAASAQPAKPTYPDPFSDRPGAMQNDALGPVFSTGFRSLNTSDQLPAGVSSGVADQFRQMSPGDQKFYNAVRMQLPDDVSRQQLDGLAERGVLQDQDAAGNSLIGNLARLSALKSATNGVDPQQAMRDVINTVANPNGIQQAAPGTSTAANVQYMMATRQPAELARMYTNLISPEGWTATQTGRNLVLVDSSVRPPSGGASNASQMDRIMQASLTQQGRRGFAYDTAQAVKATGQAQQQGWKPASQAEANDATQFQNFVGNYGANTLNKTDLEQQNYDAKRDVFFGPTRQGQMAAAGSGLIAAEQSHLLNNSLGAGVSLESAQGRGADRLTNMMDLALNRPGDPGSPVLTNLNTDGGPLQVLVNGVDTKNGNVTLRHLSDGGSLSLAGQQLTPDASGQYTVPMALFQRNLDSAFIPSLTGGPSGAPGPRPTPGPAGPGPSTVGGNPAASGPVAQFNVSPQQERGALQTLQQLQGQPYRPPQFMSLGDAKSQFDAACLHYAKENSPGGQYVAKKLAEFSGGSLPSALTPEVRRAMLNEFGSPAAQGNIVGYQSPKLATLFIVAQQVIQNPELAAQQQAAQATPAAGPNVAAAAARSAPGADPAVSPQTQAFIDAQSAVDKMSLEALQNGKIMMQGLSQDGANQKFYQLVSALAMTGSDAASTNTAQGKVGAMLTKQLNTIKAGLPDKPEYVAEPKMKDYDAWQSLMGNLSSDGFRDTALKTAAVNPGVGGCMASVYSVAHQAKWWSQDNVAAGTAKTGFAPASTPQ